MFAFKKLESSLDGQAFSSCHCQLDKEALLKLKLFIDRYF